MSDLIHIPFHDTEILAVDLDGKPFVVLRPMVEGIGMDFRVQQRKLEGKSWASVVKMTMQLPGDTQRREHLLVDVRTALMLLATINETKVSDDARPLLVAYQAEVADVIEAYWTNGGVINPRATESQLSELARQAQAQMSVIQLAKGIIADDYLEAKARLVLARSMGEEPEVDPDDVPVDVSSFLKAKGVTAKNVSRWSSSFGRRLKALYVAERGTDPAVVNRFVNGAWIEVKGYFGRDLPLFEKVFDLMRDDLLGDA